MKGVPRMYLIALCDDETAELNKTEQMLCVYEKEHPDADIIIKRFDNANELLFKVKEQDFQPDLILMDIYMPEKMGIEAAKELRDMGNTGRIVFLTTSREHALEAFGVDAAQYLVKPISKSMLFPILDRCLGSIEEERRKYLLLRTDGRIRRIMIGSIIYCEAQGKTQFLYLADGTQCLLRMTMAEIYEMISQYREFVRVGIAYVVNLEHIDSLNAQELHMDNGKRIYLPRGSYQPLRESYFKYYCEEVSETV